MKYTFKNKKNISNNKIFNKRIMILLSFMSCIIIIVILRISFLQIIQSKNLIYKSDLRSLRTRIELSKRGSIKDRLGNLLAISIPVKNICIDPKFLFSKKKK